MTKRQQIILSIAGLLIVVKFLILPLIDWQNQQIESIQVQTKQLAKVIPLIKSQDLLKETNAQLEKRLTELQESFPSYLSNENLRVKTQRDIESVAKADGLELEVFDWISQIDSEQTNLTKVQFRIEVRGDIKTLSRFHWNLYGVIPSLVMRDYELRTFTQRGKRTAELSVILEANYFMDEGGQ